MTFLTMHFELPNKYLTNPLHKGSDVMDKSIMQFFYKLDRSFFMDTCKECAHIDTPFPIGYGQTISQPTLVRYMTELLELDKSCRVLEIGTGSGYQTAFLAEFGGEVYTVECIEPLLKRAKEKLDALGYRNIAFQVGDGSIGLAEHAPYDRIIVTAAACEIPKELLDQLNTQGILVIPVGNAWHQELLVVKKDKEQQLTIEDIEGVRFVPLVGKYQV